MTTLIAVRHGESTSNLNGTFTGQWDVDLTPLGVQQAERTAMLLKDYPITAIYASDLKRAMETARPTAEMKGLKIVPDARLREIYAGDWERRRGADIAEMYPESHRIWKEDIIHSRPDGGESILEVMMRTKEAIDEIVSRHRGECVAVFSHAGALRTMAGEWLGRDVADTTLPWMSNASVSVIEYEDDGSCRAVLYAYDKHQGDRVTILSRGLT